MKVVASSLQVVVFLSLRSFLSYFFFVSRRLVGDVLVATGFLSYAGPFNQEYRDALLSSWQKEMRTRKIPNSKDLNVTGMLVDSATVRRNTCGHWRTIVNFGGGGGGELQSW
jgi:hypothetical protein